MIHLVRQGRRDTNEAPQPHPVAEFIGVLEPLDQPIGGKRKNGSKLHLAVPQLLVIGIRLVPHQTLAQPTHDPVQRTEIKPRLG